MSEWRKAQLRARARNGFFFSNVRFLPVDFFDVVFPSIYDDEIEIERVAPRRQEGINFPPNKWSVVLVVVGGEGCMTQCAIATTSDLSADNFFCHTHAGVTLDEIP